MPESDPKTLVSTEWLADHLDDADLRLFDASWFLPTVDRDAKADYAKAHIPGARFFDIDEIADLRSPLPHMLPTGEKFLSRMRAMGVGDGHQVVVYDSLGIFSAPRVWWTFRAFGKSDIAVLDGGLPKWLAEGRAVTPEPPVIRDRHMTIARRPDMVKDVTEVAAASKLGDWEIIDARAADRFRGEAPEPRPGLRMGHIPGSKNVPWNTLLNDDGTMKPPAEIKRLFEAARIDLAKPAICTCGSGVNAAILALALTRIGHQRTAVYDGSWAEWGMYDDLNVAIGEA
ncbi:MAG: 3-mercaptopyruvate sulfurtransferase [Rhodobacterales bacterium CG2_30_65_12]|nr:MAG: 3-mercaptopyruvate sulfurtransferase [Rhodobacterales bacterium CG2_30_65_12]